MAEGLSRAFGPRLAVDNLTLRLPPGRVMALLGPNGAGKTTTVRMFAALLRPSSGTCRVAGFDTAREPDQVRRTVGLITDSPGLYSEMRLREYLEWFGGLYGLSREKRRHRASVLIDRFGLQQSTAAILGTLSRGMRQRVALARCLMHNPQVLLLDEPTTALDPGAAAVLRTVFRDLAGEGRVVVLCTHNLREAEKVADAVTVLVDGRTVYCSDAVAAGGSVFTVELAAGNGAVDPAAVAAVPGVQAGSVRVPAGTATIVYQTPTPALTNPALVAALVSGGYGVVRLREEATALEAIYARYTQQDG